MPRPHILHLVDDTTAGGVMRLLDFIRTDPRMGKNARHSLRVVKRGSLSFRRLEADVIVSHLTISWRALPALISLRARHAGIPLIHVEHSYTQAFTALNVPDRDRFLTLLRIGYSMFDHLVAVSHAQARWMFRRRLADLGALSVIHPQVDLSHFATLPDAVKQPRHIGAIGRLDRQKGFDLLIQAFRTVNNPDLTLTLFGDGPERATLEALAQGDTRIHFAGHVSNPVEAMHSVDAIAMPSRWEACGIVAFEALAAGRPLLVSGQDGLKDHVSSGAIPVPAYTVSAWRLALENLAAGKYPRAPRPEPDTLETQFVTQWETLLQTALADTSPMLKAG